MTPSNKNSPLEEGAGEVACKLCRFVADPNAPALPGERMPVALVEDDWWIVALNENQAALGRIYLVLKRHEEDVSALTPAEQASMFRHIGDVRRALTSLFQPDHFNYMFHMNLVRHAHFHVYPRYSSVRHFAGVHFHDPEYGGHYNPAAALEMHSLDQDYLVAAIRDTLVTARGGG